MRPERWLPYANGLLSLALAALIGHAALELGLRLWQPLPAGNFPPPAARHPASAAPRPSGLDLEPLRQSHLFGQAARREETPPAALLEAPETPLQLILQGTLATDTQSGAKAIVAGPDGNGRLYQVGDTLPSGAQLHSVHPDRVILLRNNRYETLSLPLEKTPGAALRQAQEPAQAQGSGAPDSRKLADYRQQILAKPSSMNDFLRLRPAESNGQLTGYTLLPGKNPQIMADFGLQNGDIVTSVNGTRLDSAVKGLAVMQQLTSARRIDLEILRNGQPMNLSFSLD
jgi:general secretion pathway protein C